MEYHERYLSKQVQEDLKNKIVFIAGPRQVGKTTFAKNIVNNTNSYLNWDIAKHRESILKQQLPDEPVWIFDEIHKYSKWRNFLKGLYDEYLQEKKIIVTGSAMLDYYRHGGDSLQGRYHYHRMHPLSVNELSTNSHDDFITLLNLGGFPEPLFSGSEKSARRWQREYRQRLIEEDLISLELVRDLGSLELLMLRLAKLVGSPLSINSLREDLQVSHKAVTNWLEIFCRLYAIFRIPPFGSPLIRAVKKEQKHYMFNWALCEDEGAKFENLVASHLLKWVQFQQDSEGTDVSLQYFRDIEGREVDFVIVEKDNPIIAIECKLNDREISKNLQYFKTKFPNTKCYQLYCNGDKEYITPNGIKLCQAMVFLKDLV